MYKVIVEDKLNSDRVPQILITVGLFEDKAKFIADQLNNTLPENCSFHYKVVPASQELNLRSVCDLLDKTVDYKTWLLLTGADALPKRVAKYWYKTTILKKAK